MVRECSVRLEVEADEPGRQSIEDRRKGDAGHSVPPIRCNGQIGEHRNVDDSEEVLDVSIENVDDFDRTPVILRFVFRCGDPLDVRQPGVLTDRRGAGQAELQAVVFGRVVRCGHDDAREIHRS